MLKPAQMQCSVISRPAASVLDAESFQMFILYSVQRQHQMMKDKNNSRDKKQHVHQGIGVEMFPDEAELKRCADLPCTSTSQLLSVVAELVAGSLWGPGG